MITTTNITCSEVREATNIVTLLCEAVEEGDVTDDWKLIVDIDLVKLSCTYLYIQLQNTGNYDMDFELRRTMSDGKEAVETSGTVAAGDFADFELTRPIVWRLYVRNTTAGKATKYKVLVRAVR